MFSRLLPSFASCCICIFVVHHDRNQPVTDTNVAHAFDGWNLRDHRCLESIGRSGEEAECWNRGLFADFWQGEMGSKLECVSVLIPVPPLTPIVF